MAAKASGRKANSSASYTPEVGSTVWTPCSTAGFRSAVVVSIENESVMVDLASDGQKRISRAEVRPFFDIGAARPNGCADNTELVFLDDANILQNLQTRFLTGNIYTYTANVLLAVNPYKQMGHLYTNELMKDYKNIKNAGTKPPHPYAIADTAYRHLQREWRNQALVISGESGAGKTETAKITMRYLADVSRTDAVQGVRIQDKIINANPILESFGNAQTVRNRNSSRFGKYNEMHFNKVGSLVGAGIKTYLLEGSRVVSQQEGEQNYHIFYQMLCGMEADELDRMLLDSQAKYQLLYTERAEVPQSASPEFCQAREEFLQLRAALEVVGMGSETQSEIFDVVAALIHLGEVQFGTKAGAEDEAASLAEEDPANGSQTAFVDLLNPGELGDAAELLGLSESRLLQVLKWKEMRVVSRQSHIRCPRTKSQSCQTLHSIIRILYKRLFEQIVERINTSSSSASRSEADVKNIGTLDIYGFERLAVNSFEQLCINLANERLQQFFVEEVLQAEQNMYDKERIRVALCELPDSTPVVTSIQNVLSILDDHSKRFFKNLVNAGDDIDQKFCENVYRDHITASQDRREPTRPILPLKLKASRGVQVSLNDGFYVRHYAGEVEYRTCGWIQKNNDALVPEIEALLRNSTKQSVSELVAPEAADPVTGERFTSVSSKYIGNLNDLLTTLHRCKLHYIRCFNPNNLRTAGSFNGKYVLDQVVQCGTVELVNIMHNGYPNRCKLDEIRRRYSKLLPADFQRYGDRDFAEAVMLAFKIDQAQWTVGTSRLFLKAGQLRALENLLDSGSVASKDVIDKIRRQFLRRKFRAARNAILFAIWLPKYARTLRTVAVRTALRKACYINVRLHRWLGRARKTLYGVEPRRPSYPLERKKKSGLANFLFPATVRVQAPCPRRPELFIALNRHDALEYVGTMQGQIDWQKQVHDTVLAMCQKATTESVLYYDGKHLISSRLDPKMFLVRDADAVGHFPEGCLTDIRYIDVAETGLAMQTRRELAEMSEIVCICQHRRSTQVFATFHKTHILVWTWFGTDRSDADKMSVLCHAGVERDPQVIMYGMCFLSDAPECFTQDDGHVLLLLTGRPDRQWLTITIISVYHGTHRILHERNIGQDGSLLDATRSGVIFQVSHSGRVLVVGGRKAAQFFEIERQEVPDGLDALSLRLIHDVIKMEEVDHLHFVSCLCMPAPTKVQSSGGGDWIVLSDTEGDLYGFLFLAGECGKMLLSKNHGRFSSKQAKHDRGIPVSLLLPTYGSGPFCHYAKIKEQCVTYTNFLEGVECEQDRFLSLGDNGKLLSWNLERHGWTSQVKESVNGILEDDVATSDGNLRRYSAAQNSRLAPHVLVVVDNSQQKLMCIDTARKQEQTSAKTMCRFGGA